MGINVLVFGSRVITDYAVVKATLDKLYKGKTVAIISGKAPGADRLGERWAKETGAKVVPRYASWTGPDGKYNPQAGFERNSVMVEECDEAVGFWDGLSPGTKDTIDKLVAARKNHVIVTKEGAMIVTFEK